MPHRVLAENWRAGRRADSAGSRAPAFFPAKPLGYGDGGAVFTDEEPLYRLLCSLRVHGKGADKYENIRLGLNARLDTLQAAILLPKLAAFDAENETRNRAAALYGSCLQAAVSARRAYRPIIAPAGRSTRCGQAVRRSGLRCAAVWRKQEFLPWCIIRFRCTCKRSMPVSAAERATAQLPSTSAKRCSVCLCMDTWSRGGPSGGCGASATLNFCGTEPLQC